MLMESSKAHCVWHFGPGPPATAHKNSTLPLSQTETSDLHKVYNEDEYFVFLPSPSTNDGGHALALGPATFRHQKPVNKD